MRPVSQSDPQSTPDNRFPGVGEDCREFAEPAVVDREAAADEADGALRLRLGKAGEPQQRSGGAFAADRQFGQQRQAEALRDEAGRAWSGWRRAGRCGRGRGRRRRLPSPGRSGSGRRRAAAVARLRCPPGAVAGSRRGGRRASLPARRKRSSNRAAGTRSGPDTGSATTAASSIPCRTSSISRSVWASRMPRSRKMLRALSRGSADGSR